MYRPWLIWTLIDLFLLKIREARSLGLSLTEKMIQVSITLYCSVLPLTCETQFGHPSLKLVSLKGKCHHEHQKVSYMFWLSWFPTKSAYAKSSHVANLSWPQAINTKKVLLKLFKSTTRIHQIFHPPSRRNFYYEYYPVCHSQMMLTFIPFFS